MNINDVCEEVNNSKPQKINSSLSSCRRWMISGRFQDILPKESLTMSIMDWEDLYRREKMAQVHHSVYTSSGCFLQLDQRQLVMSWISDVAHRLAWEKSTFHLATGLIDQYMFCLEKDPSARKKLDRSSLAATFAAAVVTAASLGECLGECHDRRHCPGLPPLHRFVQSSGIIRSNRDIVEMQIQLLVQTSKYGGPSLLNKTPAHMTLHYLSRLKHLVDALYASFTYISSSGWSSTYIQMISEFTETHPCCRNGTCWINKIGLNTTVGQAVLGVRDRIDYGALFEKIMFASELALYSGINLLVPGSRIAASVLIHILFSLDPVLQVPNHQQLLYTNLCLLDYDSDIRPYMPYLDPLIRRVISLSIENIHALESHNSKSPIGISYDKAFSGMLLIHRHHTIPEKLLSGIRVSTLIAMHSRMNQPSVVNPFILSSPSSLPVSPYSSFSSNTNSPAHSFHCSPIFYPFNSRYMDENSLVHNINKAVLVNTQMNSVGTLQVSNSQNHDVLMKDEANKQVVMTFDHGDNNLTFLHRQSGLFYHSDNLYTTCSTATNSPILGNS
ncbi:uncharacterized protein CMU_006230 [Cryptosporidium muris RN66]|uniref:Cyclin, N-terminal domain-containing protein n=1 Tax=Cryptosporidium muris (strain RN66) TaxID=441375 RepID=B6AHK5_CRYMR|nr:uncharacterized protein CMU_006230 [Cryptosporidium muris RN66]EEA07700.1 hypothetical protein, conserved [Cryptosporidium muris RN66]|eukprot:XP_002142049.1 hypothetical protein [Cryptosporidium muris RN66]